MASKAEVIRFLFGCFFVIGSAAYCTYDSDCNTWSESCCSDNVCRETCYYCSYNYQCGTGEECCDGDCLSSCSTYTSSTYAFIISTYAFSTYTSVWSGGVIAAAIISTIVFFAIVISIVACCCCACCPCYHHRSTQGTVHVLQPANQPFVTTTQMSAMQNMQQYPPPANYNQLPAGYAQTPPPYPSYPQQPGQYPPPQAQGQPPAPPPVSAGEPVKF